MVALPASLSLRVVLDFLECSVRPTYYSLAHKGILQAYMRSWKFEGSNDAANWVCNHPRLLLSGSSTPESAWVAGLDRTQRSGSYLGLT